MKVTIFSHMGRFSIAQVLVPRASDVPEFVALRLRRAFPRRA
jgi:hypothetical protein